MNAALKRRTSMSHWILTGREDKAHHLKDGLLLQTVRTVRGIGNPLDGEWVSCSEGEHCSAERCNRRRNTFLSGEQISTHPGKLETMQHWQTASTAKTRCSRRTPRSLHSSPLQSIHYLPPDPRQCLLVLHTDGIQEGGVTWQKNIC